MKMCFGGPMAALHGIDAWGLDTAIIGKRKKIQCATSGTKENHISSMPPWSISTTMATKGWSSTNLSIDTITASFGLQNRKICVFMGSPPDFLHLPLFKDQTAETPLTKRAPISQPNHYFCLCNPPHVYMVSANIIYGERPWMFIRGLTALVQSPIIQRATIGTL